MEPWRRFLVLAQELLGVRKTVVECVLIETEEDVSQEVTNAVFNL